MLHLRRLIQPVAAKKSPADLESRIGSHWLNRIGITALLIGVSYFLKFAFDNNWIGPAGRVTIGLLAGIGVVIWSERFRAKGYAAFSYSLKAVGIGTLYLSLWAAFQVYNLIPSGVAFAMMLAVTRSDRGNGARPGCADPCRLRACGRLHHAPSTCRPGRIANLHSFRM